MSRGHVILVDDEEEVRRATGQALELAGFTVEAAPRAERALERFSVCFNGVVVTDIRMPKMDGMALLAAIREIDAEAPVILITGHGDVPLAVEAMRQGAYDFLEKPFAPARLAESVERAAAVRRLTLENRAMRAQLAQSDTLEARLIGRAPAMVALRQRIRAVASADIDVLVLGETGSGKELIARAVHDLSERREKPFVAVNLAAMPAASVESELFGHEAGAFAGAHRARAGKFEHARGGTLFLDEIAAAPLALQAKLLRVIEERMIERLGSSERIALNVRFVASSNRDLTALVAEGAFRDDLLYRLAVATLSAPPLRERLEDAPRLFQHLANLAAARYRREPPSLTAELLAALAQRDWPGNVRELRNAADRYVLGLGLDDESAAEAGPRVAPGLADAPLSEQIERFERSVLSATLARFAGALKPTYEALGLSRKTLYEKMQRHGLKRQDFGADDDG